MAPATIDTLPLYSPTTFHPVLEKNPVVVEDILSLQVTEPLEVTEPVEEDVEILNVQQLLASDSSDLLALEVLFLSWVLLLHRYGNGAISHFTWGRIQQSGGDSKTKDIVREEQRHFFPSYHIDIDTGTSVASTLEAFRSLQKQQPYTLPEDWRGTPLTLFFNNETLPSDNESTSSDGGSNVSIDMLFVRPF